MSDHIYNCLTLNLKIRDQKKLAGKNLAVLTEVALAISYYGICLNNKLQVERFINRRKETVYYDTESLFCTTLMPINYEIVSKEEQLSVI